jgi:hypothetical protein
MGSVDESVHSVDTYFKAITWSLTCFSGKVKFLKRGINLSSARPFEVVPYNFVLAKSQNESPSQQKKKHSTYLWENNNWP